MNASAIVRKIMSEAGVSQKKIADQIGLNSQQAVFNMLNAKLGMRIDNFIKIMNALGYEVIVRNKDSNESIIVDVDRVIINEE